VAQGSSLHTHVAQYSGIRDAFTKIRKTEGIRGLYRGFGASLIVFAPENIIWWGCYGYFKKKLYQKKPSFLDINGITANNKMKTPDKPLIDLLAGAMAGIIMAVVTNPLDVAKTRFQMQGKNSSKYKNFFSVFAITAKEEGLKAFSRGIFPRTLHLAPVTAVLAVCYESSRMFAVQNTNHAK